VVAISRELGAQGERVGALVAEQLGYRYVDEDIVAEAAAKGNVSPADIADAERRRSLALRLLEGFGQTGPAGYGAPLVALGGPATNEAYQELIRTVIAETAARGSAVIVAHAASIALAERGDVLRVLVTASPTVRAQRVAAEAEVELRQATRMVKTSDAERRSYFKRFYGVRELPTQYDLVVNTDTLSPEQASGVVVQAASG
jgi:hypothetical protein